MNQEFVAKPADAGTHLKYTHAEFCGEAKRSAEKLRFSKSGGRESRKEKRL